MIARITMASIFSKFSKPLWGIIALWMIVVVLPLGNRGLWDPDEPRYLQVAWEMATSGHYIIPQINGGPYTHKPPLFFWLTMAMSTVVPFEIASRGVTALASLFTVLFTYAAGRKYVSPRAGLMAALILMTANLYLQLMVTGNMDILLTCFITLSMVAFLDGEMEDRNSSLIVSYVACGLGILAKGPVAILIPWLSFGVWNLYRWRTGGTPKWGHLIWGPLVALVVVLFWLVPAGIVGGKDYLYEIVVRQNAGRAVHSFAHQKPWYYMLINFPLLALPWTFLIPIGVRGGKILITERNRAYLFHLIWFLTVLVFFSLMSGKRGRYLLPMFPAASVLLAGALDRVSLGKTGHRLFYFTAGLVYTMLFLVTLAPYTFTWLVDKYPVLHVFIDHQQGLQHVVPVLLFLPLGIGFCIYTIQQIAAGSGRGGCYGLAAGMLLFAGLAQAYYIPLIDYLKCARHASSKIIAETTPTDTIAFWDHRLDSGWNYYLNRQHIPIIERSDLADKGKRPDVVICKVKKKKTISELTRLFKTSGYDVLIDDPIGSNTYLIFKKKGDRP